MKRILTILFICLSVISKSQVAVTAGGGIAPTGSYAGYYGTYLQGATKVVYDTVARNAIPSYYRDTLTFMVYTKSDSSYWILNGGTANGNYKKVSQFSSITPFVNGGNSFGSDAYLGTNDKKNLNFKTNGVSKFMVDSNGIFRSLDGSTYITPIGNIYISQLLNCGGAILAGGVDGYNGQLGLPDTANYTWKETNSIAMHNNIPYYYTGSDQIWHPFYTGGSYSAGYGLNLTGTTFKVDSNVIMPKIDSNYLFITPTYFNANKGSGSITGNSPTISSSTVPFTYWNGTNHIGYTSAAVIDSATGNVTFTGTVKQSVSSGVLKSVSGVLTAATSGAANDYLVGTSLSATRNVSTGSVFTYNSATGAYNLDTTKYQQPLVSGTNIKTIVGSSILGSGNLNITGGSTGQIQFNTSNTFNGSSNLTWDNTASQLQITGGASAARSLLITKGGSNPTWLGVATSNLLVAAEYGLAGGSNDFFTGTAGNDVCFKAYSSGATSKFFIGATSGSTSNLVLLPSGNTLVGSTTDNSNGKLQITGNLALETAGNKILIATGTNASIGTSAAMVAGTITISTTAVTASSKIFLTNAAPAGTVGVLSVGTIVAGTSFVINSSSALDTSTVNWFIIN